MTSKLLAIALAMAVTLGGCGDECSSYSNYSCDHIRNKARYNVSVDYVLNGDRKDAFTAGTATGLAQCGAVARNAVADLKARYEGGIDDWGYVCCMITSTSGCAEKHR